MKSFGLSLNKILNRDSINAKIHIHYIKGLRSDYFESFTSFHKPIWIRKQKIFTKFHLNETEDVHTNVSLTTEDVITDYPSDTMELDEKFGFAPHQTVDESEQINLLWSIYSSTDY